MPNDSPPQQITSWQFAGLMARPMVRITLILATVVVGGIVMGIVGGWGARSSILALGGSIGIGALYVYRAVLIEEALDPPGTRSWGKAARGNAILIPFAVSVFLTFYQGIWESRLLLTHFTIGILVYRIASIYIGFRLAVHLAQLTDILNHLSHGRLVVRDQGPAV